MTESATRTALRLAATAALALVAAGHAVAQSQNGDPEPWHNPAQGAPPVKPHATSSLEATSKPAASEQHQSRALAAAVFSRPAAAQRAADKATAANIPPIPPTDPKPEWLGESGPRFGGEGVQVTKPF